MRITPALRMQFTRALRAGHAPDPKNGVYGHLIFPQLSGMLMNF